MVKLKILLVDDEPKVLRGLRSIINRADEEWEIIGECKNGLEALSAIEENAPDVVISDIKMPSMDGLELVRRAKEINNNLKFIILSGYADFTFAQQALKLDTVDYILKPPDFKDILSSIRKVENYKYDFNKNMEKDNELSSLRKRALEQRKAYVFQQLLYDMNSCAGNKNVELSDETKLFFSKYALFMIMPDNFSYFVFDASDEKIKRLGIFKERVFSSISKRNGCMVDLYDGTYCCILPVNSDSTVYLKNYAAELLDELSSDSDYSITIGISKVYDSPENISNAFKECLIILRNKVFFEKRSIICLEDISSNTDISSYPFELEHQYIESLKYVNNKKSEEILEHFVNKAIKISNQDPALFKGLITEFIIIVSRRLCDDENVNLSSVFSSKTIYNNISRLDSIDDIKELLTDFTQNVSNYFKNKNSSGCRKIINDIKQYIRENYFKSITLRQVANDYFMNESYLSDLFKKETGCSFTKYLTKIRMERAKVLLKQMDLKTYDISEMVGYNDSRYFNKIFKKYYSMTPFEYRERVLNHEA